MGIDEINVYARPHYQYPNSVKTRRGLGWRIHKQADSLDTTLAECTPSQWSDLQDDSSTQAAFDTTATTIWGTDYSNLPAPAKAAMRDLVATPLP